MNLVASTVSTIPLQHYLLLYQILSMKYMWVLLAIHDDVIKSKHFPRNWPFVRGIHRSPVNSPHKGQWRGALMFSLICAWINDWVNNREAGDLRRHRVHYDVTVMNKSVRRKKYHLMKHNLTLTPPNHIDRQKKVRLCGQTPTTIEVWDHVLWTGWVSVWAK